MMTLAHWGYHWGSPALPLPIVVGVLLAELGAVLAIIEALLIWRWVPRAFTKGFVTMVTKEPIKSPWVTPAMATGQTANSKYRIINNTLVLLRNRWDRNPTLLMDFKGEASIREDHLILTVRYPIGILVFIVGYALAFASLVVELLLYSRNLKGDLGGMCAGLAVLALLALSFIYQRRLWRGFALELKNALTETAPE